MGVVHAHKVTKEELGLMMTGALDLTRKYGGQARGHCPGHSDRGGGPMNRKEPLFRVVKRESSSPVRQALAYVAAVVIALLIGAALLSSMDVDPLTFYQKMVTMGIPGNKFPWRIVENFVKLFVPLLITSLALSLAFRMRFWNIGGEGQFIMGAICAAAAAHKLGPGPAPAPGGAGHGPVRHPGRRPVRPDRGPAEGALQHQRDPAHPGAQLHRPLSPPVPGGDQGWLELLPGPRFRPA